MKEVADMVEGHDDHDQPPKRVNRTEAVHEAHNRVLGGYMESSDLVVLSRFRSVVDAQIAKGILDEAEIESMIRSDNAGGMYPALAEAELLVRAGDAEKAEKLLPT